MPAAVVGRCLADYLRESPAERPEARKRDIEADVGHAAIGFAEKEHRSLDAAPLEVAVRCLAENVTKTAAEVCRRDVGDRGDGTYVERLGVRPIHGLARPQQAPVEILSLAAHADNANAEAHPWVAQGRPADPGDRNPARGPGANGGSAPDGAVGNRRPG